MTPLSRLKTPNLQNCMIPLYSFTEMNTEREKRQYETKSKFPPLINATLDELHEGLRNGHFTSVNLVNAYIGRINEVNDQLHAVTEVNPDAVEVAEALDNERADGIIRGPWHGIPLLVKNNIATCDRMSNTAGSYILQGTTVSKDATVITKLRQAGAVILGKANLIQWSGYRTRQFCNGWSPHGGQVYGAYLARQDPLTSSSGSGVSTDLGLAFAALGTETEGSITGPAHVNGVVGVKPTVGLTSRYLVVPISEYQDSVGPMARTVRDAAALLQVIAGRDDGDSQTLRIPGRIPDYGAACDGDGLRGKRIGVPWNVITLLREEKFKQEKREFDIEVVAFRGALAVMSVAGATIVDADFARAKELWETNLRRPVVQAAFMKGIKTYLSELDTNPSNAKTLSDLRDLTRQHGQEGYPAYDTAIWDEAITRGFDSTDPRFASLYNELEELAGPGCLFGALDTYNLIAVTVPTSMAPRWTAAIGAPAITVPLGYYPDSVEERIEGGLTAAGPGRPFGIAFMGRRWSDADLIGIAYAFEQRTLVRGVVTRKVEPWTEIDDVV